MLTKNDFTFEEDELISIECGGCNEFYENSSGGIQEEEECPECSSDNLINSTCHEGLDCGLCDHTFDTWEDGYAWTGTGSVPKELSGELICDKCFEDLEEGE